MMNVSVDGFSGVHVAGFALVAVELFVGAERVEDVAETCSTGHFFEESPPVGSDIDAAEASVCISQGMIVEGRMVWVSLKEFQGIHNRDLDSARSGVKLNAEFDRSVNG